MKNIIRLFSFLGLMTFMSCGPDTFTPIVELDIPPHTPRLVVRADWTSGSDSLAVFVSRSKGSLDKAKANFNQTYTYFNGKDSVKVINEYYDTVPNTKVELLRNGQLLGTIPYYTKGYHVAKGLFKLDTTAGTTYTIRVSAQGFETVEATQKIQNRLVILRGSYKKSNIFYTDPNDPFSSGDKGDEFTIDIQDNVNDENVYILSTFTTQWGYIGSGFLVTRDSLNTTFTSGAYPKSLEPNADGNYLSDNTFNGQNYTWRFWVYPGLAFNAPRFSTFSSTMKTGDKVTFSVRSTSKDYLLFIKSLNLANAAQDNPFFTEPVFSNTNVKNGYGIFTIGSEQTVRFVIP